MTDQVTQAALNRLSDHIEKLRQTSLAIEEVSADISGFISITFTPAGTATFHYEDEQKAVEATTWLKRLGYDNFASSRDEFGYAAGFHDKTNKNIHIWIRTTINKEILP